MKKLLIVDATGAFDRSIEREGTHITWETSIENTFKKIKPTYSFNRAAWEKAHPWGGGGPARGMAHALHRRQAEIAAKDPYWDGIILSIAEDELLPAIGACEIAHACGCRYKNIQVRIKGNLTREYGYFVWVPTFEGMFLHGLSQFETASGTVIAASPSDEKKPCWRRILYQTILVVERRSALRDEREASKSYWPGLYG